MYTKLDCIVIKWLQQENSNMYTFRTVFVSVDSVVRKKVLLLFSSIYPISFYNHIHGLTMHAALHDKRMILILVSTTWSCFFDVQSLICWHDSIYLSTPFFIHCVYEMDNFLLIVVIRMLRNMAGYNQQQWYWEISSYKEREYDSPVGNLGCNRQKHQPFFFSRHLISTRIIILRINPCM